MGRVSALAWAGRVSLSGQIVTWRGRFCAVCKQVSWIRYVKGWRRAEPGLCRWQTCPRSR